MADIVGQALPLKLTFALTSPPPPANHSLLLMTVSSKEVAGTIQTISGTHNDLVKMVDHPALIARTDGAAITVHEDWDPDLTSSVIN